MPNIQHVLVTARFQGGELERLRAAVAPARCSVVDRRDRRAIRRALADADVAIIAGDIDDDFLAAPRLCWVHCDHAGVERSASPDLFARGLVLSSSSGRSAPALAEHALFFMLALAYRFPAFYDAQRHRRWGIRGQHDLRALHGRTLGIVGLGATGRELALRAAAMGMRVWGYRRHAGMPPPGVERMLNVESGDALETLLAESDFVVLAVPLTDATFRLIDHDRLSAMKPGAFLINMARGDVLDERALLGALRSGHLAGAAIDCASEEPLPWGSPLWRSPNLLLTPHVTPRLPDRDSRSLDIICENLRRYRADERPLLNEVTPDLVYSQRTPPPPTLERLRRNWRKALARWRTRPLR